MNFDQIALFIVSLLIFAAPLAFFPMGCNLLSIKKNAKKSGIPFWKALTKTETGYWTLGALFACTVLSVWIFVWNLSTF